jgi:2'-5' RNA ligase
MKGDSLRAFVAVELDTRVRAAVVEVIEQLRSPGDGVKWVQRENLHLTLQFLGQTPAGQVADICHAIAEAVAASTPLELEIRGTGAFPNARRPRTVWLGVTEGSAALATVQKQVQKALKRLGFPPEARAFSPHLTIGRVREGGPPSSKLSAAIAALADQSCGRCPIAEVVLFSSELTPTGPIYAALGRMPLAGA